MNEKKRLMFILEDDYYFITIKLLAILNALDCVKKKFIDYRKLAIIYEFIKDNNSIMFFEKAVSQSKIDIIDNERLLRCFYDSNMTISVIKRVLFFLEKQSMVNLSKNSKYSCIDVQLRETESLNALYENTILEEDFLKVKTIQEEIQRIRSIKFETLQKRVFGFSEVEKWVG